MKYYSRSGFTMLEVVFVVVVIGILAAIALPRFSDTADRAYESKGQSVLAAVRSALATERQKRILRGDTTPITDLGLSSTGGVTTNAFDHFSADGNGNFSRVLDYPIPACNGGQRGCWTRSPNGLNYSFLFPKVADGKADFILQNNRLDCNADANDCKKIE